MKYATELPAPLARLSLLIVAGAAACMVPPAGTTRTARDSPESPPVLQDKDAMKRLSMAIAADDVATTRSILGPVHSNPARRAEFDNQVLTGFYGAYVERGAPCLPEMIEHDVDGWLLPPGDESAWAEALRRVARSASQIESMGTRARERAEREADFGSFLDRYEALYRELLESLNPRSKRPRR